ncbi:McrC family protein [Mycolicibacterium phocaicum]|uniref:Restriction endonuclease n=1 Tax=Mycolicibacterium phocaicum TaxID=319706 RepID=A0A7I7ZR44_9MYCO|nr:restriction endonuclease [Mycolicibacterium phocaicum]TLH72348.1 restriction endonuclease [Mycolicibacterium phocaicum]BBZ55241.1 McrBC 5-methylcytosine restriction system component [Mycolicibacterium phocaicum]
MTPQTLTLIEGGDAERLALCASEYVALQRVGFVSITPTLETGIYELAAGRKVGAVSLGERQILVHPKIADLNRLLFLLGYARDPDIWRDDPVDLAGADELLPGIAEAFARIASRAVEQGLLQGYRTISERLPVLRGRMLAGEQMTRLYGLPVPLAVEYDDFTVDIAENRLLLMATMLLLTVPRLSETARRRLLRLRRSFADVAVLPRGTALPSWQPSRLNTRYQSALRLAEIILAAESFEHQVGDVSVTGYLFDMWRIFEDFVTTALSEAFGQLGGRCIPQDPLHLDDADQIDMQPDLVWYRGDEPRVVIDAKYKAEKPNGYPNADLYQMLAYCTVLRLSVGHLVYAKGNEPVSAHSVRGSDVVIHCHALDLALSPAKLLMQIDKMARSLASESAMVR